MCEEKNNNIPITIKEDGSVVIKAEKLFQNQQSK